VGRLLNGTQAHTLSPALRLWREVVHAEPDAPIRKRLKAICGLANPADIAIDKARRRRADS